MKVSKNFTIEEFEYSETAERLGIQNSISDKRTTINICALIHNILQPIRDEFGPVKVTSGYRSQELNKAIGGAKKSQHLMGEAADIVMDDMANVFDFIKNNLEFDQLIWEKGDEESPEWIHVSYSIDKNRNEILLFNGKNYTKI